MAPTIQDKTRDRRREKHSEQSDLLTNVKFSNNLPDIPFEPKLLKFPFNSRRYVTYTPTCLEENFKFDIITDHDLGVHIDLIDPDTYKKDSNSKLNPDDEKLLLEDDLHLLLNPQSGINDRASRHAKAVPWLRRTEYISTEYNRFSNISDKVESRIQKLIKEDEDFYKDHESQINAINATFSNVKKKITKHYSKPNVYAIEELPVFPDFQLWKHPCAQVLFDSDPYFNQQNQNLKVFMQISGHSSQKTSLTQIQKEKLLSQAMIRGMMDDSGNQFVAYFLPTEKTMNKFTKDLESNVDFTPEELY